MRKALSVAVIHLVAWAIGLMWMIPFLGLLMTSIRPFSEISHGWWSIKPFTLTIGNYVRAWNLPGAPLREGLVNSLIITIPATVASVFLASLAGYGFARFRFRTKKYLFVAMVLLLALPPQIVGIPVFSLLKQMKLLNTHLGTIAIHTAWGIPWLIFFLRNYFSTLPIEVEEAARVDGASDFTVFYRIILPMSIPALISATVLQFIWTWNDLFFALITLFSPEKMTAIQRLPLMKERFLEDWELLSAASVIVSLVPISVFSFLQKYYVKGMTAWIGK